MSDRTSVIGHVDSLIDHQLSEIEHIDQTSFLHWTSKDRFDANRFRYSLIPWIELRNMTDRFDRRWAITDDGQSQGSSGDKS
jgi:hypothetical protein